ncbi:MAG: small multi-drug export protein [Planctomycetota bacterium]|jgi:uncharacterized membrane protein
MPATDLKAILAESARMEKDRPVLTRLHLLLPLAVLAVSTLVLYLTGQLGKVGAAAAGSFFYLGKLVIVFGALPEHSFGMTALQLATLVVFMDLFVAYCFAYNLHHVHRLPRVGPWLERLQSYCRYWLVRQPWMRRWAFTGVMLFVMFPLTGTGAPGGSILGRIVGLRAVTTLTAIAVGSLLGCSLMIAFAARLQPIFAELRGEWWFTASGLAILAILLYFLIRLGRRLSRAAERHAQSQDAGGEP